jgi:hypothetical protein
MTGACGSDDGPDAACPSEQPTCANNAPSYKDDIAPIFAAHCFACHSVGGLAERKKSFDTYAQVKDAQGPIYRNVYTCYMPKKPEPQPPLSPEEKQRLLLWLKCDAPNN